MSTQRDTGPAQPPLVVGVDGSAASAAALRWAVAEAGDREVWALAAWTYPPGLDANGMALSAAELADAQQHGTEEFVRTVLGDHPAVVVRTETHLGDPATVLTEAASGAAMLVLGSHGRGRVLSALLGSVATACVHRAACPVVVIPPGMVDQQSPDLASAGPSR